MRTPGLQSEGVELKSCFSFKATEVCTVYVQHQGVVTSYNMLETRLCDFMRIFFFT